MGTRSRVLVTSLVTCVALCVGVSPAAHAQPGADGPRKDPQWTTEGDARACSGPIWPRKLNTEAGPGQGRRVLVIGDSLTRNARGPLTRKLRASGWTPTVRCFGGKRLDWAIAQAKRAKRIDQLPDTVVIAIGTNDMRWIDRGTTKARMTELLKVLGKKRTVLWVDTYASGGDRFTRAKERWFNKQVKRQATKRENMHRVNWGSYARTTGVRFADALHYTKAGEKQWAARIVQALDNRVGN
ncbi:MAG TPA: GDSL-type esterase/lipase family protein [Candidatus Nanopelagicales bacterium]|nr:GDSL-type esterase/lipase family protein [Candidatus Nanopelagicales bacterium]